MRCPVRLLAPCVSCLLCVEAGSGALLKTLPLVLTIALFAPAYAEPLTGPEESLHRLQLSGENDWQLSSYQQHLVRPKSAWSLGDDTPESDGLLGLSFRSLARLDLGARRVPTVTSAFQREMAPPLSASSSSWSPGWLGRES